jgi:hypothetical protein
MGHKRVEETLGYIDIARTHAREVPADVLAAGASETDVDRRVILMLGARGTPDKTESGERRTSGRSTA